MRKIWEFDLPTDRAAHPMPYGKIVLVQPHPRDAGLLRVSVLLDDDDSRDITMAVQAFAPCVEILPNFIHGASSVEVLPSGIDVVWHVCYAFSPVDD